MSWWNDLSTHRNASTSGFDGAPRHTATFASPRERRSASPEHHGDATSTTIVGSFRLHSGIASEDTTWCMSAIQSDAPPLWQTSNSTGISDQLGLSENSSVWGQQRAQQCASASPRPRGTDTFMASLPHTGKGILGDAVRPLSGRASFSSFNDSTTMLSVAVNSVSAASVDAAAAAAAAAPAEREGHRSCHIAEARFFRTSAGVAGGGGGTVKSANEHSCDDDDSDDASLYDDVDLGTISSLIASLQCHSAQPDVEEAAKTLRSSPGEANRFEKSTTAQSLPPTAPHARGREFDRSTTSGGSPFAPAVAEPGGDTVNVAPLHLTPSLLEGLLANFQTALKGRSNGVSTASPVPQIAETEMLHPDRCGSPEVQDDFSCDDRGAVAALAADGAALTRRSSPLMRSHVTSVVAHQVSIDSNPRGTPVQDFRRGVAATVSVGSSCSDPSTPIRRRGTSATARRNHSHSARHPLHNQVHHERVASPDSSIDCFFSQATPPVTNFASAHYPPSSSTTEESVAATHPHVRTGSESSLPAAASGYKGSAALHQHVDERSCITVVDPQRRKLHVPLSAIQTTKALNGRLKTPSLCLLFQSGRCRQGDNCYQVHVDPATVDRLRADVEAMPCCCLLHGDCNYHLVYPSMYEGRSLCIAGQFNVPLSCVAYTAGLQRVLQEETSSVAVNPSVLCRLHGQPSGCRFGADCKFIHVCCSILNNELAQVMSSAATAAAASTNVPAAQQTPQQLQQTLTSQRLCSSTPGSPSMLAPSQSVSGVVNLSLTNNNVLSATVMPPQMMALSASATVSVTGELSLTPPLLSSGRAACTGSGSPMTQELHQSNSSHLMGSPGAGTNGGTLYNRNFVSTPRQNDNNSSSLVSSTNFSPTQLAQGAPTFASSFSGAAVMGSAAPSSFAGGAVLQPQPSGPLFTVTTVQQCGNSPAQSPADRPAPPPLLLLQQRQHQRQRASGSMPGSPELGYHLRTFSAQSVGPHHHPFANSALVLTPNRSGAGSPMNASLPAAHSLPNMCGVAGSGSSAFACPGGRSSGFSSPAQRQPPRQTTPPQSQPLQQQQRHHHSASQQFYLQQINQDGTVSFVPVSMVPNLRG